jgi:hypothetical protein
VCVCACVGVSERRIKKRRQNTALWFPDATREVLETHKDNNNRKKKPTDNRSKEKAVQHVRVHLEKRTSRHSLPKDLTGLAIIIMIIINDPGRAHACQRRIAPRW